MKEKRQQMNQGFAKTLLIANPIIIATIMGVIHWHADPNHPLTFLLTRFFVVGGLVSFLGISTVLIILRFFPIK